MEASEFAKYQGQWIVVDVDWERVLAAAVDPREGAALAKAAARTQPVYLYRVPTEEEMRPPIELGRAPAPAA